MSDRTLAAIGARYDEKRETILARIRSGEVSASMSGIEYYPEPWTKLDMADPADALIISRQLSWDPEKSQSDYEGLEPIPRELQELWSEVHKLLEKPCGPDRENQMNVIMRKIFEIKVARLRRLYL